MQLRNLYLIRNRLSLVFFPDDTAVDSSTFYFGVNEMLLVRLVNSLVSAEISLITDRRFLIRYRFLSCIET